MERTPHEADGTRHGEAGSEGAPGAANAAGSAKGRGTAGGQEARGRAKDGKAATARAGGAKAKGTANGTAKAKAQRDLEMIVAWASFAAMAVCVALAQFGILAVAKQPGEQATAASWFTPERYVGLVWPVIWALLAIWLIRLKNTRRKARKVGGTKLTLLGLLFIATMLLTAGWTFAWTFGGYAWGTLLALLATLAGFATLFFSRRHDPSAWGVAPFSLFSSWMLFETARDACATGAYYLSKDGPVSGGTQAAATVVFAVLLLGAACAARLRLGDWTFGLAALWGIVGVAWRLMDVSKATAIVVIALATVAAIVMYVPWRWVRERV